MLQAIKSLIPVSIKNAIKQALNNARLSACVRELRATDKPSESLLRRTRAAWGNEGWSGDVSYLAAVCEAALRTKLPVLECGTGITTILLGIYAGSRGIPIVSLEHNPEWRERVLQTLRKFGLKSTIADAPLKSYDSFDWYTLPADLPGNIGLVICDGPPSSTRGGRVGMLPLCEEKMDKNCIVLLDDVERPDEKEALATWQKSGAKVKIVECGDGSYAVVSIA